MDILADIAAAVAAQLQTPTLSFLLGGMAIAALGARLTIPEPVYKFIVVVLLLKVGLGAGASVREADPIALAIPALLAAAVGVAIVFLGRATLARWPGVAPVDGVATAGLFGAVSASTLAAAMAMLDAEGVGYEGFVGALYPFMDVAALVTAIVLARIGAAERARADAPAGGGAATMALGVGGGGGSGAGGIADGADLLREIVVDTLRSPAISALLLGLAIGVLGRPDAVYESFYAPLFAGLLSILMLIMGMEAWSRLSELWRVAHAYAAYALLGPLAHGLLGFGAGWIAHEATGFSGGGAVLLAVMAASSSDISGPPTLRAALPEANPSTYLGASTGLGTPVAILSIPLWIALADVAIGL